VSRPRLLDLFCCAGGAGMGYHRAGFDVVGVDIEPQKNYPFEFHQADALEYLEGHGHEFDAIHASPPCQAYSVSTEGLRNGGKEYPDLLGPTREALEALGKPYVIENVPGAPMRADYELCGCYFGLQLRRERWFETNWTPAPRLYAHDHTIPSWTVTGNGTSSWDIVRHGRQLSLAMARDVMGMPWAKRSEISEAIPPAYTELIGSDWIGALAHVS
jgi:DNA (cytosine-5)-methyltransferase 1